MSHLFVGLRHFGLSVVPFLVDLVDGGVDLLAEFLSTHETNKHLVNVANAFLQPVNLSNLKSHSKKLDRRQRRSRSASQQMFYIVIIFYFSIEI